MAERRIPVLLVNVSLNFGSNPIAIGRLALQNGRIYFEYDAEFVKGKLDISPFKLPLKTGVQTFNISLFEGLPGVFNDSLPDGWGRLLLDRVMRSRGYLPESFSALDRLSHVGRSGMGALVYEPEQINQTIDESISLDVLAKQSRQVLEGGSNEVFAELLALNGSSAGARPKAMIGVNSDKSKIIQGLHQLPTGYEPWLVKFSNHQDGEDAGAIEYVYSLMAREAGIEIEETHLFPANKGSGYFATRRFDQLSNEKRLHMHTACGLLHSDFRIPSLDYQDLIKLTMMLTRDVREAQKMFRLAVFNVLSHNRDDHAKNFSYLMNEQGKWRFAPAYDLTFSSGPDGEQSTMVIGEAKKPAANHLMQLANLTDLTPKQAQQIIDQTRSALAKWESLAKNFAVSKANISRVKERIG